MKIGTIVSVVAISITLGGIILAAGQFIGTTNTSLKYVEEKITVVADDVKEIRDVLSNKEMTKEIAKGKN